MTTTFINSNVWATLTMAATAAVKPAHAAVAYFGQGAADLLPLPAGSKLVVDCGDLAVKSGQTCPAELLKLHERGVSIYRDATLHAKVFVIGERAYVGSTNGSNHSAQYLKEAVMATDERACVADVRRFVDSLCLDLLGPDELKRLADIYKPPRFVSGAKLKAEAEKETALPTLRIINCDNIWEEMTIKEITQAEGVAQKIKVREGFELDYFGWNIRKNFPRKGEIVMLVEYDGGRRDYVRQPGHVIKLEKAEDHTLVFVETEPGDDLVFQSLPKSLRQLLWADGPQIRRKPSRSSPSGEKSRCMTRNERSPLAACSPNGGCSRTDIETAVNSMARGNENDRRSSALAPGACPPAGPLPPGAWASSQNDGPSPGLRIGSSTRRAFRMPFTQRTSR